MKKEQTQISSVRLHRIRTQGYCNFTDANLSELAFGNRFAYIGCGLLILIGVITANIPVLSTMMAIAFFGIILPYHPFDYIYNYAIRGIINKPKLPRRSKQLKFACSIATTWIAITIYLFYTGHSVAGYISGGVMLSIVFLVSTTDLCIPSLIYNFLFNYEVK
jgi:fatty acid desaturase